MRSEYTIVDEAGAVIPGAETAWEMSLRPFADEPKETIEVGGRIYRIVRFDLATEPPLDFETLWHHPELVEVERVKVTVAPL